MDVCEKINDAIKVCAKNFEILVQENSIEDTLPVSLGNPSFAMKKWA